jgi:hypothetical protein
MYFFQYCFSLTVITASLDQFKCHVIVCMCVSVYLPYMIFLGDQAQDKQSSSLKAVTSTVLPVPVAVVPAKLSSQFDMLQIPMLDPDMSGRLLDSSDERKRGENEEENNVLNQCIPLDQEESEFVDKWSKQISTKLLCGWVLLDEVCERSGGGCHGDLPLLRDLHGEVS